MVRRKGCRDVGGGGRKTWRRGGSCCTREEKGVKGVCEKEKRENTERW